MATAPMATPAANAIQTMGASRGVRCRSIGASERCRGAAILQEKVATLIQIHRPGSQEHCDIPAEETLLCVTLNRMGHTGRVAAVFDGPRQRFNVPRGHTRDGWATLR